MKTHLTDQEVKPFQTSVYFLDMITSQDIYITYDFPPSLLHILWSMRGDDQHHLLRCTTYHKHLKAKDTWRQEVECVNDAVKMYVSFD
jgi:hypothetical protein